jgi:hypothetical protein
MAFINRPGISGSHSDHQIPRSPAFLAAREPWRQRSSQTMMNGLLPCPLTRMLNDDSQCDARGYGCGERAQLRLRRAVSRWVGFTAGLVHIPCLPVRSVGAPMSRRGAIVSHALHAIRDCRAMAQRHRTFSYSKPTAGLPVRRQNWADFLCFLHERPPGASAAIASVERAVYRGTSDQVCEISCHLERLLTENMETESR